MQGLANTDKALQSTFPLTGLRSQMPHGMVVLSTGSSAGLYAMLCAGTVP